MKVFLVRHGQSQDSAGNKKQSPHTPLSQLGLAQADAVTMRLQNEQIDLIISSPLNRALQTAEAISTKINIPITRNNLIREIDAPSIEGVSYSDPLHKKFMNKVSAHYLDINWKFKNGDESFRQLLDRAGKFRDELVFQHGGKNILLVSHGFFMMCLITVCVLEKGCPDLVVSKFIRSLKMDNTCISELEYSESTKSWTLSLLNDHLHIKNL